MKSITGAILMVASAVCASAPDPDMAVGAVFFFAFGAIYFLVAWGEAFYQQASRLGPPEKPPQSPED
jgi:hypothetical protein